MKIQTLNLVISSVPFKQKGEHPVFSMFISQICSYRRFYILYHIPKIKRNYYLYTLTLRGFQGGYTGEVLKESDEGQIMWRYIKEFLNDSETVDHLKYYLFQLLDENSDFYTGIEIKNDIENLAYNDNREHFNGRKINNVPYGK